MMMPGTPATLASARPAASLVLQRAAAALIGLLVVGVVGFSPMAVAHNAGHDYRHSMAFPCH